MEGVEGPNLPRRWRLSWSKLKFFGLKLSGQARNNLDLPEERLVKGASLLALRPNAMNIWNTGVSCNKMDNLKKGKIKKMSQITFIGT